MNFAFEVEAKLRRAPEEAPAQEPMRPAKQARNPSTDQKRVRRQQARQKKTAYWLTEEVGMPGVTSTDPLPHPYVECPVCGHGQESDLAINEDYQYICESCGSHFTWDDQTGDVETLDARVPARVPVKEMAMAGMRKRAEKCHRCNGSGTTQMLAFDPDDPEAFYAEPEDRFLEVDCGRCGGSGEEPDEADLSEMRYFNRDFEGSRRQAQQYPDDYDVNRELSDEVAMYQFMESGPVKLLLPSGSPVGTFKTVEEAYGYLLDNHDVGLEDAINAGWSLDFENAKGASYMQREADILKAMAKASLPEQRALALELDAIRRRRREARQADLDVDLADSHIRDCLTPVITHSMHTTATDWLDEVVATDFDAAPSEDVHQAMVAQASLWFRKTSSEVKADREEFAEQAMGMARRLAGQYGQRAALARQAFLDHVAHLHRVAESGSELKADESGQGQSGLPDEVPLAGNEDTFDRWFWDTEQAAEVPSDRAPVIQENKQGRRKRADRAGDEDYDDETTSGRFDSDDSGGQTCADCGDPIERDPGHEDPQTWHHDNGEKHDHEARPSKESRRVRAAMGTDQPPNSLTCPNCGSKGAYTNRMDGSKKCQNCDHEWDPEDEGASKESRRRTAGEVPPQFKKKEEGGDSGGEEKSEDSGGEGEGLTDEEKAEIETLRQQQYGGDNAPPPGDAPPEEKKESFRRRAESEGWPLDPNKKENDNVTDWDEHEDTGDSQDFSEFPEVKGMRREARSISEIAQEINRDWKNPYFGAVPYIDAMYDLETINDTYGADDARYIVSYFLSNARTWKGETAKRIKAELKGMLDRRGSLHQGSPATADPSGQGVSGLDDVEVGDEHDRPMWPWEIGENGSNAGSGASNVSRVPTPGGSAGYPQPRKSSQQTFAERVQANLKGGMRPFEAQGQAEWQAVWTAAAEAGRKAYEDAVPDRVGWTDTQSGYTWDNGGRGYEVEGYAYITFRPANTPVARWIKARGVKAGYRGGLHMSIPGRGYERRYAYARAFADVWNAANFGTQAYPGAQLD